MKATTKPTCTVVDTLPPLRDKGIIPNVPSTQESREVAGAPGQGLAAVDSALRRGAFLSVICGFGMSVFS